MESAYAAVCGLGQFIFYVNGKKVSDHELDSGWINYDKKVQYVMFDITDCLQSGNDAFGISVGNGFYLADKGGRYFFEMPPVAMKKFMLPNTNGYEPFGTLLPLKAMMIIRYTDGSSGTIATDETWDDGCYGQVYQLIAEVMDSNLKSVHMDCLPIEKTAWLEESHLLAPSMMFYRDIRDLWSKIFDDAVTDQYTDKTKKNGLTKEPVYRGAGFLPPIAPAYGKLIVDTPRGNFWDLIAWSSFPILGAKWYYQYYGNPCMIERYYDADCKYMDYLQKKVTEDGFIAHGLGDWGNPQTGAQATANVETAFYYEDLATMAEFADFLGKTADRKKFTKTGGESP